MKLHTIAFSCNLTQLAQICAALSAMKEVYAHNPDLSSPCTQDLVRTLNNVIEILTAQGRYLTAHSSEADRQKLLDEATAGTVEPTNKRDTH